MNYDAVLVVSFGGPEKPEDVMPFLENVTRGRNVPRERLEEVAQHYYHFGGRSPINDQTRALIAALRDELARHNLHLPVYWGNRNWHPMLADTVRQMKEDGVQRAVAFVSSAFSSYSGCRQYKENIAQAQAQVGQGAPRIDKIRVFYNHPGFVHAVSDHSRQAITALPEELREEAQLVFTAHSIPLAMAKTCRYESQLLEACAAVATQLNRSRWRLVYQSRSGPPSQPWLGPDILDALREMHRQQVKAVVVVPIGFVSDHMEVLYDLDTEARALCDELGLVMTRAASVGTHPSFVAMVRELIEERIRGEGVLPGLCHAECCPPPAAPGIRPAQVYS
ncbi:MAG: ferrochelatase [Bryobacteraceae bacterium]|nr:ferrochelatase [Bryobacteraceae bacterium]MDW8380102.1 ferrochelatase [Bryobacterales bacterium]